MTDKKIFSAIFLLCVFSAAGCFAQAFLNTGKYFAVFPVNAYENVSNNDFIWMADVESYEKFAKLSGRENLIDTTLEFALLSYYSPSVIGKRPAGANTILPANNARLAAQKLGAAVFRELVEVRFFYPDNTAAAGKYEEMLRFISEKSGVTLQQIEQYFRANIKSMITEIVTDEFNLINFSLTNFAENRRYFMTMIRNPSNGRYTLNYEVPAVTANVKTISAASRDTMFTEMGRRTTEFSRDDIEFVRSQALLIPAVALQASVRTEAADIITAYYLNPNTDTYNTLKAKQRELLVMNAANGFAASSFTRVLFTLNEAMADAGF